MDKKEALTLMGLDEPFSKETLQSRKREKFFKTHPDHGGSEKAFIEMQEAFKALEPLAIDIQTNVEREVGYTTTGEYILDLGKGFGSEFTGMGKKSCSPCKGQGYTVTYGFDYLEERCSDCKGSGQYQKEFRYTCRCCNKGQFTQKNGRVVECRVCKGTGIYVTKTKPRPCIRCWGMGYTFSRQRTEKKKIYHTCLKCKGVGEIELNNPVLPSNALSALKGKFNAKL